MGSEMCIRDSSKHKLKMEEVLWLEGLVDNMSYSCGYNIQNVDVEDEVLFVKEKSVQARDLLDRTFMRLNLVCNTMIELPYNSAGYDGCFFIPSDIQT